MHDLGHTKAACAVLFRLRIHAFLARLTGGRVFTGGERVRIDMEEPQTMSSCCLRVKHLLVFTYICDGTDTKYAARTDKQCSKNPGGSAPHLSTPLPLPSSSYHAFWDLSQDLQWKAWRSQLVRSTSSCMYSCCSVMCCSEPKSEAFASKRRSHRNLKLCIARIH